VRRRRPDTALGEGGQSARTQRDRPPQRQDRPNRPIVAVVPARTNWPEAASAICTRGHIGHRTPPCRGAQGAPPARYAHGPARASRTTTRQALCNPGASPAGRRHHADHSPFAGLTRHRDRSHPTSRTTRPHSVPNMPPRTHLRGASGCFFELVDSGARTRTPDCLCSGTRPPFPLPQLRRRFHPRSGPHGCAAARPRPRGVGTGPFRPGGQRVR
jgi:hypothetical protein